MNTRLTETGSSMAAKEVLRHRKSVVGAHTHPVNAVHHDEATFGERLADGIASFIGSWTFLIIQTVLVATWVTINSLVITGKLHIDPYPYILLNLAFSTQAAYTGPVLLLAGNRQSQKDRLTLEHAAAEADKADQQNMEILKAIASNTEVAVKILKHVETIVSNGAADQAKV